MLFRSDSGTIEKINDFFTANPIAKGIPSSREEIINAEKELGIKFDKDYVFFLLNYGGSLIKEKEIYGLRNSEMMGDDDIINLTKVFRENERENNDWLIIGTDYAGNPVGIDKEVLVL